VLTNPEYMEDHAAVLEEEISRGLVPLPQLPKHKLVRVRARVRVCVCVVGSVENTPPCP
jgi:hypothetical protein